MAEQIKIDRILLRDEAEAIAVLQKALENQFSNNSVLFDFENWPTLRLKYSGDQFHGTITPDVAKAIVELQDALNRSYTFAAKHTGSLRFLTNEERKSIELVAKVEEGSSIIEIDLGDWATTLSNSLVGKMTGTEIVVAVVGTVVVLTAGWIMKQHLKERSAEKMLVLQNDGRLLLSQEESKRLAIVTEAMNRYPYGKQVSEIAEHTRDAFIRSAFSADELDYQSAVSVTGEEARKTHRAKRREAAKVQLNGTYIIKAFAWASDDQSARVKVIRENDSFPFSADIEVSALTNDQRIKFKDATFDQSRVYLSIDATILDNEVTTAKIVSVSEQPRSGEN